jgi:formylglycine-generating enzyme required for sulfatase activity
LIGVKYLLLLCLTLIPAIDSLASDNNRNFYDPLTSTGKGPEMVRIKGGCFQMGSPTNEKERGTNEQRHRVCVEDFAIGKYEITNAQFRAFRPYHDSGAIEGHHSLNDDMQPAVRISWFDAVAYAEWLSQQTGHRYRLPTEAEWEYAARGGTTASRFWGEDPNQACTYANVHEHISAQEIAGFTWSHHECEDGYPAAAPVGSFLPNAFGLYDVLGNVWEWTCSTYTQAYNGSEMSCAGKEIKDDRVLRGGSWINFPQRVRSAYRSWHTPDTGDAFHGLRLVRPMTDNSP